MADQYETRQTLTFVQRFSLADFRMVLLCLAVLIYAAFGSPTPDTPGVFEFGLAVLLCAAVGVDGAVFAVRGARRDLAVHAVLFFGVSVPLLYALAAGNDARLILRDAIAFLYFMMPLFLVPLFRKTHVLWLVFSVTCLGALFAVRTFETIPYLGAGEALFYLANMPSVLFAAIFCAGLAIQHFVGRWSWKTPLMILLLAAVSFTALLPVLETQQRASVGVFVVCVSALFAVYSMRVPKRGVLLLVLLMAGGVLFVDQIAAHFEVLGRKTQLVGVNMRFAEWQAVWQEISGNPLTLLIGQGWGASFASPAVADFRVNFTHGLLSSLLLKTGLVGLVLGCVYIGVLLRRALPAFSVYPALWLALAGPIAIDVLLYASFKSLDFGLVLALFSWLGYVHKCSKADINTKLKSA